MRERDGDFVNTQPSPVRLPYTAASPQVFREAIGRFVTGVTVVSTVYRSRVYGTTASAVSSVSLEPPTVLVCLNKDSATGIAVAEAGGFVVNILAEEHHELARQFARKGGDKAERHLRPVAESGGLPVVPDSIAHLVCQVSQEVSAGTHRIFIAEVVQISAREGAPLAYFRGQFGRFA